MKTGNVIIGGTYTATHTYRFGDKLTGIASTIPGETASVAYNYDGLGKRRFRNANGQYTWWRWDLGWNVVTQYADTNTDWTIAGFNKMFVPYGHAALAETDVTTTPANAAYSYLAQDHLGTGRFVYNQAKTQTAAFEHYPYGARYSASGAAPYHEFTGKPWDPDSNLFYFPYRYLRPDMARWTSADPAGLVDGPNVYGYVGNNPMVRRDYLGLAFLPMPMEGGGSNDSNCGVKDCKTPVWGVKCGPIYHEEASWPEQFGMPGSPPSGNVKDECKECKPTRRKTDGQLEAVRGMGIPCSQATCGDIIHCLIKDGVGTWHGPWTFWNNCKTGTTRGFKNCCLTR